MLNVRLLLLGPPRFNRDAQPVELNNAKAIALLGYLAANDVPQNREHLIDLLWPDSLPEAARKNLRNTLWAIRKQLDNEIFQTEGDWVSRAAPVWCDTRALETAVSEGGDTGDIRAAVDLYRATFLDGLALDDAPDFEIWLAAERERFGQLYLHGLERLLVAYRTAADWGRMIETARRALAHDHLQEPMYRALMEAYAQSGDRAEALRQYDKLHAALAQELGVAPLPETDALRSAIVAGTLSSSGEMSGPDSPWPRPRPSPPPPSSPPFVGRRSELAALNEELELAATNQARVVFLHGELGIGKTRLWQEWSTQLSSNLTVLETRCLDTARTLPFAPLTRLFNQADCIEHLLEPAAGVPVIWLAELTRLIPEIRQRRPELPAPPPLPPDEERIHLFEAFTRLLQGLAGQPLVLFIDDLHWADRTTLDWLVYLLDRTRQAPLMLVCSYRRTDAPAHLAQIIANWSREGLVRPLRLKRLTLPETTELMTVLGGDLSRVEQLQTRSAGNPYFLLELARAGPDDTPPGLADLIRTRLERLPQAVQQVLQAAATLETEFDVGLLRRTSGRGEEETLNALDILLAENVLVEQGVRYEFTHPLVAGVVRQDLSLARRSFLHRRAAEALETIHRGRLEVIAGQLAGHYTQAGQVERAAHFAELAAERALQLASPAEAVGFYRQALQVNPTPERRMRLGQALYLYEDLPAAQEAFLAALSEFEAQNDRSGMGQACLELALGYLPSGQADQTVYWAEQALKYLDPDSDPESHARLHHLLGAAALRLNLSLTEAERHLTRAAELAAEHGLPEIGTLISLEWGNLLAQRGDLPQALQKYREMIGSAQASRNVMQEVLGHNNLAYHAMLAGDMATARQHIEQGLGLVETHSLFFPRQYLFSTRGEIALAQGELEDARQWFLQALAEAERNGNRSHAANIRANLGLVAREQDQPDEALMLLVDARREIAGLTETHLQTQIDLWLAELHLRRGERAAAEESLARAETRLAGPNDRAGLQAWARRIRSQIAS